MYFILIGLKIHLKGCVHTRRDVPLQSTVHTTRPHVTANVGFEEKDPKFREKVEYFFKNENFQTTCCPLGHFLCYQVHWDSETGTAKNKSLNVFFSFRLRNRYCQQQKYQRIFLGIQIILRHHQYSVLARKGLRGCPYIT